MSNISFSNVSANRRAAGIVGDSVAALLGSPASGLPALTINVTDQPSGSDVFAGLGTDGDDLAVSELASAALSHAGVHTFTVGAANGEVETIEAVVWPAEVLSVPELLYSSRPVYAATGQDAASGLVLTNSPTTRLDSERRNILTALAQECSLAAAAATLEASPGAPYYGLLPSGLGLTTRLADYARWS